MIKKYVSLSDFKLTNATLIISKLHPNTYLVKLFVTTLRLLFKHFR